MTIRTTLPCFAGAVMASAAVMGGAQSASAQSYDIDCKVILCLAGGFPSGCGDAYSYMINRITDIPPKPPFGFCAMSNGAEYTNHTTHAQRLSSRSRRGYVCPETHRLYYRWEQDSESDSPWQGRARAFCYTHTERVRAGRDDGDWQYRAAYHGRTTAIPVNYEVQVTLEPGTAHEYQSPLFRLNYRTGYVASSIGGTEASRAAMAGAAAAASPVAD